MMEPSGPKIRPIIEGRLLGSQLMMTGGFGKGLGRVWRGFGNVLGRVWVRFCEFFGRVGGSLGSVWRGLLIQFLGGLDNQLWLF